MEQPNTSRYRFRDGHEAVGGRALFRGDGPSVPAMGRGDWVYLSPGETDVAELGRLRQQAEAGGGRLRAVIPEALLLPTGIDFAGAAHIDIRGSGAWVTHLRRSQRIEIVEVRREPDAGLSALEKRILAGAAAASVRETRYDPLHNAAAEAELRSAMGDVITVLLQGRAANLRLKSGAVGLTPELLAGWCQPVWGMVTNMLHSLPAVDRVVLAPAVAELPGLGKALGHLYGEMMVQAALAESRHEADLAAWMAEDLLDDGCWLLQTRPRTGV